MPQSPSDSFSTIEDNTLYERGHAIKPGVPEEGVSREEVCGEEQSRVSDTVVRTSTRRLPVIIVAGRSARRYTVSGRPRIPGQQTRGPL